MKTITSMASAFLVVLALVGCGPRDEELKREVTLDEARTTLNEVVAATASQDIQMLSDKFGSAVTMVQQHLVEAGGWAARPKEPPVVVDSYVIPAKRLARKVSCSRRPRSCAGRDKQATASLTARNSWCHGMS